MIERSAVIEIVKENLEARLSGLLQARGNSSQIIQKAFTCIAKLYAAIPPDFLNYSVRIAILEDSYDLREREAFLWSDASRHLVNSKCLVSFGDKQFVLFEYEEDFGDSEIISYYYTQRNNEYFVVNGKTVLVDQRFDSASSSVFASPTYKELDEALGNYYEDFAKNSTCLILQCIWLNPRDRLELCKKPEHFMRDSLYQHLFNSLRSHTVKREQNVDVVHPVDIKITWSTNNKVVALIEIKWLGKSGKTNHYDTRANIGAGQLVEYIKSSYLEEPDRRFIGYLVVFDARRRCNKHDYYAVKEIKYNDEYKRNDKLVFFRFYLYQQNKI